MKPDSPKSLSLCNLIISETPTCGSAEDLNISQIDVTEGILSLVDSDVKNRQEKSNGDEDSDASPLEEQLFFGMDSNEDGQIIEGVSRHDIVVMSNDEDSVFEDQEEDKGVEMGSIAKIKQEALQEQSQEDFYDECFSDTDKYHEEDYDERIRHVSVSIDYDVKADIHSHTEAIFLDSYYEGDGLSDVDRITHEFVIEEDNETTNIKSTLLRNDDCNNYQHVIETLENDNSLPQESNDIRNNHSSNVTLPSMNQQDGVQERRQVSGESNVSHTEFNSTDTESDQIWPPNWEPTCTTESWSESYGIDCQTHEFWGSEQNSEEFNSFWSFQTIDQVGNNDNISMTNEKKAQTSLFIEEDYSSSTEINKEEVSFQRMSCIRNSKISCFECSPTLRENEANSSDLSEDEQANRRYGSIYQDIDHEKDEASSGAFNGLTQPDAPTSLFTTQPEQNAGEGTVESDLAASVETKTEEMQPLPDVPAEDTKADDQNELAEKIMETTESEDIKTVDEADTEGSKETIEPEDIEIADEADTEGSKTERDSTEEKLIESTPSAMEEGKEPELDHAKDADVTQDITCIPSVVIEPASNHEDEGEYEVKGLEEAKDEFDAIPDTSVSQAEGVTSESNNHPTSENITSPDKPSFMYKAEVLHDFEAANEDELNLKRGDIVYVLASATSADQEAGWLTGVREVDWQQYNNVESHKGLFPQNFTHKLE